MYIHLSEIADRPVGVQVAGALEKGNSVSRVVFYLSAHVCGVSAGCVHGRVPSVSRGDTTSGRQ